MLVLEVFTAWMLADFGSGVAHWWLDRFSKDDSALGRDNDHHHKAPHKITRLTWAQNLSMPAVYGWTLAAGLWIIHAPILVWLSIVFLSASNLVHRWAHDPRRPRIVSFLQSYGLMQTFVHHYGHHFSNARHVSRKKSSRRYCVMTNFLNPTLDRVKFWDKLERLLRIEASEGK